MEERCKTLSSMVCKVRTAGNIYVVELLVVKSEMYLSEQLL